MHSRELHDPPFGRRFTLRPSTTLRTELVSVALVRTRLCLIYGAWTGVTRMAFQ